MKTSQPSFHCIANLGDATPIEHGGVFVLVDKRGIYDPELWIFDADEMELTRFSITQCTRCPSDENSLSDNRFHSDSPAWFAKAGGIAGVASFCGMSDYQFRGLLSSSDPVERATAYLTLYQYHGAENFGGAEKIDRKFAAKICRRALTQIRQAENWSDGFIGA